MREHFSKNAAGFVVELRPTICEDGRGNRDVRDSKSRGRARRAIIGSIIPGNDSPAEGNWSLVIPPGLLLLLLLRAGNNYEFAVNTGDSRSLLSKRDQPGEPYFVSHSLFHSSSFFLSLGSRPRKANERANTTAKPLSIGR